MFYVCFFFFNDTATTEIYTLSLHDALPICERRVQERDLGPIAQLGHEALRVLPEVVEAVAGAILDEEVDAAGLADARDGGREERNRLPAGGSPGLSVLGAAAAGPMDRGCRRSV